MSEEQLSALLAKLKEDAGLREKLQSAADLDAAKALAEEAGFDVNKDDWLRYQSQKSSAELSDAELESVAGGWSKADADGGGTQMICCGGCGNEKTKRFETHYVGCM